MSANKHCRKIGTKQVIKTRHNWLKPLETINHRLSACSPKTTDTNQFNLFLRELNQHWDTRWDVMLRKKWAQQQFRSHRKKRTVIDNFASSFGKRDEVEIACGNGAFPCNGKRNRSVPVKTFKAAFKRHFTVHEVDACNTSRICPDCNSVLQKVHGKVSSMNLTNSFY